MIGVYKLIPIGDGDYNYGDYVIFHREHPRLYGKWEIFKDEEFIGRAWDLKEAKAIVMNYEQKLFNM